MLRRELVRTCSRGLSALKVAAGGNTESVVVAACSKNHGGHQTILGNQALRSFAAAAITAEDKAVIDAIRTNPKSVANKYKGRDWWAECENKSEVFDNPEALAMVDEYFDSLFAVCVSEDAKREVRKHRAHMMGMVDEYRQLFKEIGKNPYLTASWEVDWDKMRKDHPGKIAKDEIDFFEAMDKKLTPLLEEQRKDFVANQEEILFQQPAYVAYKKRVMEQVAPGLLQLKTDYDAEINKCEEKIAKIEEELDSLDYITIEECLEGNPELAAEIDAEIERQEW